MKIELKRDYNNTKIFHNKVILLYKLKTSNISFDRFLLYEHVNQKDIPKVDKLIKKLRKDIEKIENVEIVDNQFLIRINVPRNKKVIKQKITELRKVIDSFVREYAKLKERADEGCRSEIDKIARDFQWVV